MLCCGLLTLILSWASMAVDTAAAVVSGARRGGVVQAVPWQSQALRVPVPSFRAPTMSLLSPQGTSDFCVAPDKFIMNQTESDISAGEGWPQGTARR